jgi:dTDP-4-dehydrorhamnose reductase
MKKILVLGSNGLLGASLVPYLLERGENVITAGRSSQLDHVLNMTDVEAVRSLIEAVHPDVMINLIAATNVDVCEIDVPMAVQGNALVPSFLSTAIAQSRCPDIHLIHVSTDQVYDGKGGHKEANISPMNVYGLTKLTGELLIKCKKATILRTNFFGKSRSATRESFSDWIYNSLQREEPITLFTDVVFNAMHISSLCVLMQIIYKNQITGTYNAGCRTGISKADYAIAFASALGLSLKTASMGELTARPLQARRPLNMTMNVDKLSCALAPYGARCPEMQDEIAKTAMEYEHA